jgi:C4-type Zn-finger protein
MSKKQKIEFFDIICPSCGKKHTFAKVQLSKDKYYFGEYFVPKRYFLEDSPDIFTKNL